MELNISSFFATVTPRELSSSVAESGPCAGALTWAASCKASVHHNLLDDDEKRDAFRAWVRNYGGWSAEEIAAWSNTELNALLLQWISGDLREMGIDDDTTEIDWEHVEAMQQGGTYPCNLFKGSDGAVYFDLSC
jgi:hypothetical protein